MKSSELLRKLIRSGITISRKGKGSHIILTRPDGDSFVFPDHGSKEMATGTANKIMKWAGLK